MVTIAEKQPLSPASLGRVLDLEKSSLSRNLRPLIETGLLITEPAKAGGQYLRITPEGRQAMQDALPAWREAQAEVTARLGPDAISQLDKMISAMTEGR